MIEIFYFLILLLSSIVFLFLNGYRNNLLLIFNFSWCSWLFLSIINLQNFYIVSLNTYMHICLAIVLMNMFYFCIKKIRLINFGLIDYSNKFRFNRIIEIIYFFILLYYVIKMFKLIGGLENYWLVRSYFFGIEVNGEIIRLFEQPIFAHMLYFMKAFSMLNFLLGLALSKKCLNFLFIMSIINIMLYCVLTSGRDIIFYAIVYFSFYIRHGELIYFKRISFLIFAFIILITSYRQNDMYLIIDAFISYFTGSIVYLDILINNNIDYYFYGGIFLTSLLPLFSLLYSDKSPIMLLGSELTEFVQIANGSTFYDYYNALPTWFYFFYRDFGMIGWYVLPMIIVLVYSIIFRGLNFKNREHASLMSMIDAILFFSIFKNDINSFNYIVVVFMYLFILSRRRSYVSNCSNSL